MLNVITNENVQSIIKTKHSKLRESPAEVGPRTRVEPGKGFQSTADRLHGSSESPLHKDLKRCSLIQFTLVYWFSKRKLIQMTQPQLGTGENMKEHERTRLKLFKLGVPLA